MTTKTLAANLLYGAIITLVLALVYQAPNTHAEAVDDQLRLSHWFHQNQAPNLSLNASNPAEVYSLSSAPEGYAIRLLKKLGNWDQQHTNGVTVNFTPAIHLSPQTQLQVQLLIDSTHTQIPNAAQRLAWYGKFFSASAIATQDDEAAHLLLTFWTATDASQGRWRKDVTLNIAPGQWNRALTFTLPTARFACTYELNYQRHAPAPNRPCPLGAWQELTMVNENRDQKVLRNVNPLPFEQGVIEEHYRSLQLEQLKLWLIENNR